MPAYRFLSRWTLVGVLGTAGAWHLWAPRYRLHHLEAVVRTFAPDLLCAEIDRADWEVGRRAALSLEYRECLVPLCRELGIIVVPVGNQWRGPPSPLRLALALGAGPRWANSPAVDRWHRAWARLWPGSERANRGLVERTLEAVRRDPGRRVLVTVRVERRYAVVNGLRKAAGITVVSVPPPLG
jgi:hypothetical protein